MNKLDVAKKIITETKLALIKFISSEKISENDKKDLTNFIKESSSYDVLHFAAKGFFPKDKTTPMKSLLEQSVINRVILKENPQKSEIEFFAESCKEALLNRYSKNTKVTNYILKEGTPYSLCHLAMIGKFPTDYSIEAKRNLHETIAINISNKFGRKSFISESFIHELQGNPDTLLGRFINSRPSVRSANARARANENPWGSDNTPNASTSTYVAPEPKQFVSAPPSAEEKAKMVADAKKEFDAIPNRKLSSQNYDPMTDHAGVGGDYYEQPVPKEDFVDAEYAGSGQGMGMTTVSTPHDIDNLMDTTGAQPAYPVTGLDQKTLDSILGNNPYSKNSSLTNARINAAGIKSDAEDAVNNHINVAKYHAGELKDKVANSGIMDKLHGLIAAGKESGSQAMAQLQKTVGDHPDASHVVGAVGAAALAIYGANKLYRKYMSAASNSIQGKAPAQAAVILKNAKMKATQAKVADLQKSIAGCKATKNPAQCQKLIADKIKQLRSK